MLKTHPESPDPTDLPAVRQWVRSQTGPTAIDLFCGAGGLSLGLQEAGFAVLAGADSDPVAIETYSGNIAGLSYWGDLADPGAFLEHLEAWGIETVDLIAAGIPCQPFSRAGQSKIRSLVKARIRPTDDSRADLWHGLIAVVTAMKPKAVLLENVPDLAVWDEGAVLVGFCESLPALGYHTDARIIGAFDHGVPQHRSRLFIVGTQNGLHFEWPKPDRRAHPTLWSAIGDLPKVEAGQRQDRIAYERPLTSLQRRLRRGVRPEDRHWVYDHVTREIRPDDLEAFRHLVEGGTYEDIPQRLRRYRADIFTDQYKRLSKNHLSRTITAHMAKDGYWYIHPVQHRTLSIREAARLQTFPDWFRFAGEPSHRYRQIGNAVPPLLGRAIGAALAASLRTRRSTAQPGHVFRIDLINWHHNNSRNFPWRNGASPWMVLLAEMCLHRTRADQVKAVFDDLMMLAPTPQDLLANERSVRDKLASLGLRWRIDNVIRVAAALVETFDGVVPATRQLLMSLPGVGDYVASAVLCFGFGRPSILMDTNTMRIVSRVGGHTRSAQRWQLRLDLYRLAGAAGADTDFNYALLDLGATTCRASTPRCLVCPVSMHCRTFTTSRK